MVMRCKMNVIGLIFVLAIGLCQTDTISQDYAVKADEAGIHSIIANNSSLKELGEIQTRSSKEISVLDAA